MIHFASLLRFSLFTLLFIAAGMFEPPNIAAHPHVFIDSRMTAAFHGGELTHVSAHWTFDRFFTHQVLRDFGLDPSGDFSSQEIAQVKSGAFDNLKNYNYFIYIEVDGREIDANNPENFSVSVDNDGHLVYTFDIPVGIEVGAEGRTVEVAMYDEEFFVDMVFAEDYLEVQGSMVVDYDYDLEHSVYDTGIWGPMIRERVVLNVRGGM